MFLKVSCSHSFFTLPTCKALRVEGGVEVSRGAVGWSVHVFL